MSLDLTIQLMVLRPMLMVSELVGGTGQSRSHLQGIELLQILRLKHNYLSVHQSGISQRRDSGA
jgi:hypothetical protein